MTLHWTGNIRNTYKRTRYVVHKKHNSRVDQKKKKQLLSLKNNTGHNSFADPACYVDGI